MFVDFFYQIKEAGIPVSPTSFLTLHRALRKGLVSSLEDFYTASRSILVKSERYFDLFDQVFAYHFKGAEMPDQEGFALDEMARNLLDTWLQDPKLLAEALGIDESELKNMTPEELIEYFKERLKEQTERHDGGSKWIGTGGTSPVGHSGRHPGGMRVADADEELLDPRHQPVDGDPPIALQDVGQRHSAQALEHQERLVVLDAEAEDAPDVRALHAPQHQGLAVQALAELHGVPVGRLEHLDGHVLARAPVPGGEHAGRRPGAERAAEVEVAQLQSEMNGLERHAVERTTTPRYRRRARWAVRARGKARATRRREVGASGST